MKQPYNLRTGAIIMMIASFAFSAMQIAVSLSKTGIPLMQQILFRNLFCLAVGLVMCQRRKVPYLGNRAQQPMLFIRSTAGLSAMILLFAALAGASQGDVSIITKLNPFFVTLAAVLFLHERITRTHLVALCLAFVGAALVCKPSMNSNLFPLLLALLNAMASGIVYPMLSYMNGKVDPFTIISHFSAFSCACSGLWLLVTRSFVVPTAYELWMLIAIGICAAVGQIAVTIAYRLAPASQISIFDYSGIPFSLLMGWAFLGETAPRTSLVGALLVVLGAWLSFRAGGKSEDCL